MHLIVYVSEYTGANDEVDADLNNIIIRARDFNPQNDITGLLFFHNKRFMQIIEGEQASLEKLMIKLSHDRRHRNIVRLLDAPIKKRDFAQWHMDSFNLSKNQQFDVALLQKVTRLYEQAQIVESSILTAFYRKLLTLSAPTYTL